MADRCAHRPGRAAQCVGPYGRQLLSSEKPCGRGYFKRLPVEAVVSQPEAGPSLMIATLAAGWLLQSTATQMGPACVLLWLVQPTGLMW